MDILGWTKIIVTVTYKVRMTENVITVIINDLTANSLQ